MMTMQLSDAIALPNQSITVQLTRKAQDFQPMRVYLHHNIYEGTGVRPEVQAIQVNWSNTGCAGDAVFSLPAIGNYALTLRQDDLGICRQPVTDSNPVMPKTPYRHLACVGPESTIIRHMIADSGNPLSELIHAYRANVDYFMLPLEKPRYGYPLFERMFGDTVSPLIHPNSLTSFFPALELRDANWRAYPDDVIRQLLVFVTKRWNQLGYNPLQILGTYTTSSGLLRVCKELGIHTLANQSPDHYFRDGGWDIANPGMPDIPYFMSESDFRCPEAPSRKGVFGAAQGQFLAPASYRYWTDYLLDSSCFQREDRSFENGLIPWRAIDLLDAFVNGSRAMNGPDVINVGIEAGETMWAHSILRINRALFQRSIALAQHGKGRIVLGTSDGVRQFALRNGGAAWPPARVAVVPDIYAGCDFSRKPVIDATSIMTDHPEFHADFTSQSPFPLAFWPRQGPCRTRSFPGDGPTVPFSDISQGWPTGCVPHPLGMSDARIQWREVQGGAEVEVTFHSREPRGAFPILLWQPPVMPAPLDGAMNGIQWISARPRHGRVEAILIVGKIPKPGLTAWKLIIPGRPAATRREDIVEITKPSRGGLKLALMPKSLEPARHAYLVKTRPGTAELTITSGVTSLETHEGERRQPNRPFTLTNNNPYLRVWLKRGHEMSATVQFTPEPKTKRFSLEKDEKRVHDWLRSSVLLPSERLVFSLGCFRKCVTGTWGHPVQEDYLSIAEYGLTYTPNHLDYGQTWAPGHTAWVQPWSLAVTLHGTDALKGKGARLHLHAYDYRPGLNRVFIVTANDRLPNGLYQWMIPEGPAARFSPQSVFSFTLTDSLLEEGKLSLCLQSVMRRPVTDWIKDKAFSLLLSDLWVSVKDDAGESGIGHARQRVLDELHQSRRLSV